MAQRHAVTNRLATKYRQASRSEKSEILDQLVELTGWHRDHARAGLGRAGTVRVVAARKARTPIYSARVVSGLEQCWRVARCPAGKRLAPMLTDDHGKSACALGACLRERGHRAEVEAVIDDNFDDLAEQTCTRRAAVLSGRPRATHYRRLQPALQGPKLPRPAPANALTEAERQHILSVLRSEAYCDLAPAQVWARLLDDGIYLCSIATMYRLLTAAGENRERRRQRSHPAKKKPELIATAPNQVWSWDIERHEAFPNRAVVKGHGHRPVAACRLKLRAA